MDAGLLVGGIVVGVAGAVLLAMIYLYPENGRREKRRVGSLRSRARDAGLRAHYKFDPDRSKWGSIGGFGTYEPADAEDRALFDAVGSRIESEAAMFANEMLWTDVRLAWLGLPLLLIGAATAVGSAFV